MKGLAWFGFRYIMNEWMDGTCEETSVVLLYDIVQFLFKKLMTRSSIQRFPSIYLNQLTTRDISLLRYKVCCISGCKGVGGFLSVV